MLLQYTILLLTVLFDDRLLHSSEAFHQYLSRTRKVDPHVPLPEETFSVREPHARSLELQCRAFPTERTPNTGHRKDKEKKQAK